MRLGRGGRGQLFARTSSSVEKLEGPVEEEIQASRGRGAFFLATCFGRDFRSREGVWRDVGKRLCR